ncbi:MAG: XRE family transcriptional regulator, partial [Gemmatimonas sp.]
MDETDPIPALKQQLRDDLVALIGEWEQSVAAGAIKTDQPRMSDLERNRLERFSLETLIRFVTRVECRVDLKVVRLSVSSPRMFRF